MTRFPSLFLTMLLGATSFARAEDCDPKGITEITVTRAEQGALATYQLGEAVSCLRLGDRGDVRKLSWQLQTAGARLSEDGNIVHFAGPRKDFAVRLRAFDRDGMIDRVYSPLIAFGDGSAVAVYTSYLRPAFQERGVFLAFSGFAPTAPERNVGPQRIGNEQTYIIVGQPVLERRGKVAAAIDQAMPAWLLRQVMRAISQGEGALGRVAASTRALSYLMTYTEPGGPNANWRGDTLDRLVRLNFMGAPWRQDQPDMHDKIDQFILHELFHTASAHALNPRLPGAMTLLEGGAEAGAMAMRRRFAAGPASGIRDATDGAIARCQTIAGNTLVEKEQRRQRDTPYVCGMALQFMVAAAVERDPLDIWETLLRKASPSEAGWPAFLAAAAATGKPNKPNKPVLAILDDMTASRIDWGSGIAQLSTAGLLRRRTEAELAGPGYAQLYLTGAIFHLLGQSCRKSYGFNSEPPVFELDAPAGTCDTVPDKFRLVAMNGLRLDGDAYKAHRELARRCAAGVPVELADDRGHKIELPCTTPPAEVVQYGLSH